MSKLPFKIFLFCALNIYSCLLVAQIPALERAALIALFSSTDGVNWADNTGWVDAGTGITGSSGFECDWFGVRCDSTVSNVIELNLFENKLMGTLPTELNDLTQLEEINLANNQLTGNISTLESLFSLIFIRLSNNQFSDSLPDFSNFSDLEAIDLSHNKFTGAISDLSILTRIVSIRLNDNLLTGPIPSSINSLTTLQILNLENNNLTEDIPPIGGLTALIQFIAFNNQITGPVPDVTTLISLEVLDLSINKLSGDIPTTINHGTALKRISLQNNDNLTGVIPNLSALVNLETLGLYSNELTGQLIGPVPDLSNSINLKNLFLFGNQLSGDLPDISNLPALEKLILHTNQFDMPIPSNYFSNSIALLEVKLDHNKLTGDIPDSLNNATQLVHFLINDNPLGGTLPASINSLTMLEEFIAFNNQMTGTIPINYFSSSTALIDIDLSNNLFTGMIPSLNTLMNLKFLALHHNQFSGALPDITNSPLEELELNNNQLDTAIPNTYFSNKILLKFVNLSSNTIPSEIPDLTDLTNLINIDLSFNQFNGNIPAINNLTSLQNVRLNNNLLIGSVSGVMPDLTNLLQIKTLWLHNNQLTGVVKANNIVNVATNIRLHNNECLDPDNATVEMDVLGKQFSGDPNPWISQACSIPVATDDTVPNAAAGPVTISILTNDTAHGTINSGSVDLDLINSGQQSVITVTGQGIWEDLSANGDITFSPEAGFTLDPDPIEYTFKDTGGLISDPASITIDYGPAATDDISTGNIAGTNIGIMVTANDITGDEVLFGSVDLDILTTGIQNQLIIANEGTWDIVTTTSDQTVVFTPLASFKADPTPINYQITDAQTNSSSALITILYRSADISVNETLNTAGPYFNGMAIEYTINIVNAGVDNANNIMVSHIVTNLTITNVTGACTSLPCTIGSIASGGSENIVVQAMISADGNFSHDTSIIADENDSNLANNVDNTGNGGTAVKAADLVITKVFTTSPPYTTNDIIDYVIIVTNIGPDIATNITVTDSPTHLILSNINSPNCNSFPCNIPSLASGASETISMKGRISFAGSFDNIATVSSTILDPDLTNNSDNTSNGGNADPAIDLSVNVNLVSSSPYINGETIKYNIDVTNLGPDTATNIIFTASLSNLTITNTTSADCNIFPSCTIASLASGQTKNVTITSTIDNIGIFDNIITVAADEQDLNSANDQDNTGNGGTTENAADLVIIKTLTTPAPYIENQQVDYTITVTNLGPDTATNVNITDTMTNLISSNINSPNCTGFPCLISSLASGTSETITMQGTIDTKGNFNNIAGVTATEFDPDSTNNNDNTGNGGVTVAPTANNDGSNGLVGQTVSFAILANDVDSGGLNNGNLMANSLILIGSNSSTPHILSQSGIGDWSWDVNTQLLTFTPLSGSNINSVSVEYTIQDSLGATSNTAFMVINYNQIIIIPPPQPVIIPPVAQNDSASANVGETVTIAVTTNDSDSDGSINSSTLAIANNIIGQALTVVNEGVWTISGGNIIFNPDNNLVGNPTPISYTVQDNAGNISNTASVTITYNIITPDPDPVTPDPIVPPVIPPAEEALEKGIAFVDVNNQLTIPAVLTRQGFFFAEMEQIDNPNQTNEPYWRLKTGNFLGTESRLSQVNLNRSNFTLRLTPLRRLNADGSIASEKDTTFSFYFNDENKSSVYWKEESGVAKAIPNRVINNKKSACHVNSPDIAWIDNNNQLHIPAVALPTGFYSAVFEQIINSKDFRHPFWRFISAQPLANNTIANCTVFNIEDFNLGFSRLHKINKDGSLLKLIDQQINFIFFDKDKNHFYWQ